MRRQKEEKEEKREMLKISSLSLIMQHAMKLILTYLEHLVHNVSLTENLPFPFSTFKANL